MHQSDCSESHRPEICRISSKDEKIRSFLAYSFERYKLSCHDDDVTAMIFSYLEKKNLFIFVGKQLELLLDPNLTSLNLNSAVNLQKKIDDTFVKDFVTKCRHLTALHLGTFIESIS